MIKISLIVWTFSQKKYYKNLNRHIINILFFFKYRLNKIAILIFIKKKFKNVAQNQEFKTIC